MSVRDILRRIAGRRLRAPDADVPDLDPADRRIIDQVTGLTMTSTARLEGLLAATTYVVRAGIPGAIVECGVWRGGSTLAAILRLLELGVTDRDVYLYDTFEGMTEPTQADVSDYSPPASQSWEEAQTQNKKPWSNLFDPETFNEHTVAERLYATGYPRERIHLVKGPVEQTLPATLPGEIAILRLDTDWYESTRHELQHLYPLLVRSGVLIVDDYGHWKGCRQAVDEYFAMPGQQPPLLHRVDYTCRQGTKP